VSVGKTHRLGDHCFRKPEKKRGIEKNKRTRREEMRDPGVGSRDIGGEHQGTRLKKGSVINRKKRSPKGRLTF